MNNPNYHLTRSVTNWCGRIFSVVVMLLLAWSAQAATLLSKMPNASVHFGLPTTSLEFENPLGGTEMVLSHPVLEWRDADFDSASPTPYDDWNVINPAGGTIDGDINEIWMHATNQAIWTATTVPSTIVSIHMEVVGNNADGKADVLVDGIIVARLDMSPPDTALIIVRGLANTTHMIQVNPIGPGQGTGSDVSTLGAAALGESKVKWDQPPLPADPDNVFYGWNQPSMENMPPIAADDWVCTTTNPVTKIRWWGSFLDWQGQYPPQPLQAFQIRFWTDVPKGTDPVFPGFSHPGVQVGTAIYCTNFTSQFVGWDYDPRTGFYEACYLYEQNLLPSEYFYQTNEPTVTNIYWISIEAVLQPPITNTWGWKTRPRDTNSPAPDDAVIFDPNVSAPGQYAPLWWPDETISWDLAFELITQEPGGVKWLQVPNLTTNGMDVNASYRAMNPFMTNLLADDFLCTETGFLTNIVIWGSWLNDRLPDNGQGQPDPNNVVFTLSIHADIADPDGPGPLYSHPGQTLWWATILPGQFLHSIQAQGLQEGWMDPPTGYVFPGDTVCHRYEFNFQPQGGTEPPFEQQGNSTNPVVYWLDVQAQPLLDPPTGGPAVFGWKTCPTNWNDAATHAFGRDSWTTPPPNAWTNLLYPSGHPKQGGNVDFAFRLSGTSSEGKDVIKWSQPPEPYTPTNGFHGWNQYSVEDVQVAADDWVCTNTTPVTDIHWWGSFIGWSGGGPEQVPPTLPDGFQITIYTDVPQGANNQYGFSYPSNIVWQIFCTNYAWEFAGWDFDPRNPYAAPEMCFKYSQDLLEEEYFRQNPDGLTNTYWISIAAVYPAGVNVQYPWGWKTRLRDTNSLAPDDAVASVQATPGWSPLEFPVGTSWDMAFALTTMEEPQATEDFGDAPEGAAALLYPTKLANNGARHTIVATVFMGNLIDAELDGQPNASATGDDLNNQPDEDGVTLTTLLIPGEQATVQVQASVNGALSAWLDFNADGTWATPGDQIFTNVTLSAGANTLNFNVPTTAAAGTNTYARFRFSTAGVTNFTGLAADGEVEDYRWRIEELDYGDAQDPTFPTLYASGGARHVVAPTIFLGILIDSESDGQPSANAKGDDVVGLADEDGVTLLTPLVPGQPATVQVVASIPNGVLNAWIDFGADGSWAQSGDQIAASVVLPVAGTNLVNFVIPPAAAAGSNVFARFRFSTIPVLTFAGIAPNGEVEDYLWKIEQLDYGDAPDPAYPTLFANNGARHFLGNLMLGTVVDAEADGLPNAFATGDDTNGVPDDEDGVVFTTALIAGTPAKVKVTSTGAGLLQGWIDWNQNGSWADATEQIFVNTAVVPGVNTLTFFPPNGARSGKTFARFRLSTVSNLTYTGYAPDGEVEDYAVTLYPLKWLQSPEQGSEGVDVSLARPLADDFECDQTGPITDVHIWGSFLYDVLPTNGPGSMTLTLTFYADVPVSATNTHSHPGQALWSRTFGPGQYKAGNNFTTSEWWHDPVQPMWIPNADTNMYQFDFYITNEPFLQTKGTIYWLGVSNVSTGDYSFGWKTSYQYWNDDACWLDTAGVWHDLHYGGSHPRTGSIDLAFALSGAEENYDLDFGDAPAPYPTQLPNGARHYAVPGFYLGSLIDTEINGLPHPQALGDDLNNLADEDGVTLPTVLVINTQACVTVTLTAPATGLLDAWVDFNKNGSWDLAEQVFSSQVLVAGTNTTGLCFNVPLNAALGTNFARFRLSSAGGLTPTGLAADGEVEDYQVIIVQPRPATNVVITNITVTNLTSPTAQAVTLYWNAQTNIYYQVQAAQTLTNSPIVWTNIGPLILGPQNTFTETNSPMVHRFYRVAVPFAWP